MITICDQSFWRKLDDENCTKLIAVVDFDFGISKSGAVPWAFEDDLKFFKSVTRNFPVIMGRKTFFSIPNFPLKDRINCVISRTMKENEGAFVFDSVEKALGKYKNAWVIGGAEIYSYVLENKLVDYVLITQVHKKFHADTFLNQSFLTSFKRETLFMAEDYDITSYLRV